MPGNPIHMDHNFPLKLVQDEEIKKKKKKGIKRDENGRFVPFNMVPTDGQSYTVITFSDETSIQTNGLVQYRARKGGRKGARREGREPCEVDVGSKRKDKRHTSH
jgi:hypothetical protein